VNVYAGFDVFISYFIDRRFPDMDGFYVHDDGVVLFSHDFQFT